MTFRLIVPQSNPLDPSGRVSREWLQFFLDLGNAIIASGTVTNTTGDLELDQLVVGNGVDDIKTLPAGTNGYVATMVAGIPAWAPAAAGGGLNELTDDVIAGPGTGSQAATIVLSRRHEWTATQNVAQSTLTDASTITPNGATSNNFYLLCTNAIGATRTIAKPTGLNPGDIVNVQVKQPSSGGPCAVVFDPAAFFFGKGGLALQPTGSVANNASDFYSFTVRADGNLHGVMIGQSGQAGAGYQASSTTSLVTAGTGSKAFATQAGLAYSVGARIRATSIGTAEYMEGLVTAYVGSTLTVTMDRNSGTGTHADWNINLAGDVGATGGTGGTGPTGPTGPAGAPSNGVNLQTGTTYTVVAADNGKLISHSNASAIAVTLPQATGSFTTPVVFDVENRGAGTATYTPTTSTIDGGTSLALTTNQGCRVFSDGTNWYTQRGIGAGTAAGYSVFDQDARPGSTSIMTEVFSLSPRGLSQIRITAFYGLVRGTKSLVVGSADVMFDVTVDGDTNAPSLHGVGVVTSAAGLSGFIGDDAFGWGYFAFNGNKTNAAASVAYGAQYNTAFNDRTVVTCRVNVAGQVIFYKNGVSQGVAFTIAGGTVVFPCYASGSGGGELNTGALPFPFPVAGVGPWT